MTVTRAQRALMTAALLVVISEPLYFAQTFAGDAEIHLVFAESAARGRFFEFNPGETVSGETSPGYMMLGAALYRALPTSMVPIGLKLAGLVAWYALCWLVLAVARRLLPVHGTADDPVWPIVAAVAAAALPGSIYNANAGMENGIFAALIWGWILLALRWRWLESEVGTPRRELLLATILGLSCWLRPEGWIVLLIAFTFRLASRGSPKVRAFLGLPWAIAVGGACIVFQYAHTGDVVPTSVLSRRLLANPHMVGPGPFSFDPTFALRLLAYFPLTGLCLVGLLAKASPLTKAERFLAILFGAFFIIYSLNGTPQLARYTIFLMPILVIGAVRRAQVQWHGTRWGSRTVVVLSAIILTVIDVMEPRHRVRSYYRKALDAVAAAPAARRERTEALLAELGNPSERPVVVACESVQLRYRTDDRILVRSLDGRTDRALLGFVHGRTVDHVGYLRERQVQFITETPSYERDGASWSLRALEGLPVGAVTEHDGLSFRRLSGARTYQVTIGR